MTRDEFKLLTACRVLLLDGAAGTNFYKAGMTSADCPEVWILEHPEVVVKLQRAYVEAGCQILYAPTFGGNGVNLAKKGVTLSVEEINARIVALSKEAAAGKALIAGDMTMTGNQLVPLGTFSFDEAVTVYARQAKALYEAGVDLFVVETMIGLQEMRAAVMGIRSVCDAPIMATFTVNARGETFLGTGICAAALALEPMGIDAIGMNCSMGPDQMAEAVASLKEVTDLPLIAKANAGHPIQVDGETVYGMDEDTFAEHCRTLYKAGASLVGGCCGTTPAYMKRLCSVLKSMGCYVPFGQMGRACKRPVTRRSLCSNEKSVFDPDAFRDISRVGVALENPELLEILSAENADELFDVWDEAEGADLLIFNPDGAELSPAFAERVMTSLAALDMAICVESADPAVVELCQRYYPGKLYR